MTFGNTKFGAVIALLLLTSFCVRSVHAANLISDGGFEDAAPYDGPGKDETFTATNPFDTSWTIAAGYVGIDTTDEFVYAGNKSCYLDPDANSTSTISQVLSTASGSNYQLSFWANDNVGNSPLSVSILNGASTNFNIKQNGFPKPGAGSNANQFTYYTWDFTANSQNTLLSFSATPQTNPGGIELDNIVVGAYAAAPESSTLEIFLAALTCLSLSVCFVRKR